MNMYAYVGGDPVNLVDHFGMNGCKPGIECIPIYPDRPAHDFEEYFKTICEAGQPCMEGILDHFRNQFLNEVMELLDDWVEQITDEVKNFTVHAIEVNKRLCSALAVMGREIAKHGENQLSAAGFGELGAAADQIRSRGRRGRFAAIASVSVAAVGAWNVALGNWIQTQAGAGGDYSKIVGQPLITSATSALPGPTPTSMLGNTTEQGYLISLGKLGSIALSREQFDELNEKTCVS